MNPCAACCRKTGAPDHLPARQNCELDFTNPNKRKSEGQSELMHSCRIQAWLEAAQENIAGGNETKRCSFIWRKISRDVSRLLHAGTRLVGCAGMLKYAPASGCASIPPAGKPIVSLRVVIRLICLLIQSHYENLAQMAATYPISRA